jgi:hypothetical protein
MRMTWTGKIARFSGGPHLGTEGRPQYVPAALGVEKEGWGIQEGSIVPAEGGGSRRWIFKKDTRPLC